MSSQKSVGGTRKIQVALNDQSLVKVVKYEESEINLEQSLNASIDSINGEKRFRRMNEKDKKFLSFIKKIEK